MLEAKLSAVLAKIEQAAREVQIKNGTEEDTKIRIEQILRSEVWDELGVPEPAYEYPTRPPGISAKHWGRIDALYGIVVFEYKKPGILDSVIEQERAIEKMGDEYIPGLLQDLSIHIHLSTIESAGQKPIITGIIWDAKTVIFCEYDYTTGDFTNSQPNTLNTDVLRGIVTRVVATFKRRIDAGKLAADFGYRSILVRQHLAVKKLYAALESPSRRTSKVFEEWSKITSHAFALSGADLAQIAGDYGFGKTDQVDGIRLYFAVQTYYAIIIKHLAVEVAARFYDSSIGTFLEQIRRAISTGTLKQEIARLESGWYFSNFGVRNFLEGELFSWYLEEWSPEVEAVIKEICTKALEYDIHSLVQAPVRARDIFKLLYEELVPRREVRQKLGIYTTPDWLAEFVIDRVLGELRRDGRDVLTCRYLDPGAGTGTFLTLLIGRLAAEAAKRGLEPQSLLEYVTHSVVGFDIDSLAVLTARANYLIALASTGLLARKEGGHIEIPVYFANSIVTAEDLEHTTMTESGIEAVRIEAGGEKYDIPRRLMGEALDILSEFRQFIEASSKDTRIEFNNERLQVRMKAHGLALPELSVLKAVYDTLLGLQVVGEDGVWIPILKSYIVSTYFREFDAVVGNPPWLAYRYISSGDYQDTVKTLIKGRYNLVTEEHLMTHMEMAMLFLAKSIDVYLRNDGILGFVMPRSLRTAGQHHNFRVGRCTFPRTILTYIDCDVTPLFNVPTSAIIVRKSRSDLEEFPYVRIAGILPEKTYKSISFEEAKGALKLEEGMLHLVRVGNRSLLSTTGAESPAERSKYYTKVYQGAAITPQACWFVDVVDERIPLVTSSRRAAVRGHKKIDMGKAAIESNYLFYVITSAETFPFAHLTPNLAVLPMRIVPNANRYEIVDIENASNLGDTKLIQWLERARTIWERSRTAKGMAFLERLDYQKLLTSQEPTTSFTVVYNKSGTHLVSCVVDNGAWKLWGSRKPVLVEYSLYRYYTDSREEADFLCAVLNSSVIDGLIKGLQTRGYGGAERDIHKRPLEFPIPLYDDKDPLHRHISTLGAKAASAAATALSEAFSKREYDKVFSSRGTLMPGEVGTLRSDVRFAIQECLVLIDAAVTEILARPVQSDQEYLDS